MSRSTVKKILGNSRPLDKFEFLKELPKEYTYCERTKRCRKVGTGHFVSLREVEVAKKHCEKVQMRVGEPPIVKERKEIRFSHSGSIVAQFKMGNFKRAASESRYPKMRTPKTPRDDRVYKPEVARKIAASIKFNPEVVWQSKNG